MNQLTCLYFDEKNHRFAICSDQEQRLNFIYWHELKKNGVRYLIRGSQFTASTKKKTGYPNARGLVVNEVSLSNAQSQPSQPIISITNQKITQKGLQEYIQSPPSNALVFIECEFQEIELDALNIETPIAFFDCRFTDNFRLLNSKVNGSIWFSNSQFEKHFSLKATTVLGNVHMESTDFTGLGGASFRQLKAYNLYVDLGVNGANDLFWFNEMIIHETVSLGGTFCNEVQFLGHQDRHTLRPESYIGNLIIGKELYEYEKANATLIESNLRIEELEVNGEIYLENIKADSLSINLIAAPIIDIRRISIRNDLSITDSRGNNGINNLVLTGSSIGRHLRIDRNTMEGTIDLSESSVAEVTYFQDNSLGKQACLNMYRFTTGRFLIDPVESLYGTSKFSVFHPRYFALLDHSSESKCGEAYCSLKHWLSDSGKLDMEDVAFFHMRHFHHRNQISRAFFGGAFGWGVRLSNIAISSFSVVLAFSFLYLFIDDKLSFLRALALSAQSFISSFFGDWNGYHPDGELAYWVTTESFIGIFFITVFIGAYIRKLLR
ncbi:MAG: hypothetical protein CMF25_05645 [Kangiellaceae bacterium]|nr:hypothetical protein [Kangiellaceae bacterium]|tara:strand:+ start:10229 stop:11878 length:1650 start_codon:yes stop_codon:yes gene_type:complete